MSDMKRVPFPEQYEREKDNVQLGDMKLNTLNPSTYFPLRDRGVVFMNRWNPNVGKVRQMMYF